MNTAPPKTPKWLRRLQRESWQAELLISGAAIVGSLQLPALSDDLMSYGLLNYAPDYYLLFTFINIYFLMGSYTLIACFIGHFALRAIWVGLLGLNSVFPQGINFDQQIYSPHYVEQLKANTPSVNSLIDRLDRMCSIVFAFSSTMFMTFLAISLDIVVLALLKALLDSFLPTEVGKYVLLGVVGLFMLMAVFNLMVNSKTMRERPWVKRNQYRIATLIGRISLHVFYVPITVLAMIFQTNLDPKRYTLPGFVVFSVLCVLMGLQMADSNIGYGIRPELLWQENDRIDRFFARHYDSRRTSPQADILSATLPDEHVAGDHLELFVPVYDHYDEERKIRCGEYEADESLPIFEERTQFRAYQLACLRGFFSFSVNGLAAEPLLFLKANHPQNNQYGIQVYLPTAACRPGVNHVAIRRAVPDIAEGIPARMRIPFYFSAAD